jgi:hypothetical protein
MSPRQHLLLALKGQRFTFPNEKELQRQLALRFEQCAIPYRREVTLDEESIIDFIVFDSIGVEVKIKGSAPAIFRQCERYCQFDQLSELVLVTSKVMGLPPTINEKPTTVFSLGNAWL